MLFHDRPLVEDNLLAIFDTVRLMRKLNGAYYLIGRDPTVPADPADLAAAREWVSKFMPQAATCFPPAPPINVTDH